jgi:hypothetical protein
MYESFLRPASDPWFSPDRVDWHRASQPEYVKGVKLAVIRAVRQGKPGIDAIGPHLGDWIANANTLREAWDLLAAKGDTSPGPNGHHYDDFDGPEVWELLRTVARAIRSDNYRVGAEWTVKVPKSSIDPSRGTRPISLTNIEDRVVQRAVVEVLQPLLDPLFGRNVLGYRPGHGRLHALALAEQISDVGDRYVFVVEDIKDAFTNVPVNRLLDVLAIHVPSEQVLRLMERLLDTGAKCGVRQGGPLSPLLLNIFLHHFLDEPWQKDYADVPMIRVADDLLLICRTKKEAGEARAALESLLSPANMPLKGTAKGSVSDLRKGSFVKWLGFKISKGDQALKVRIAAKAWERLEEYLMLAHEKPDASIRAVATINGWVDAVGPCYPFVPRSRVYEKMTKLAAKQAFDEIPSRAALTSRWRRAYERWCKIRDAVKERPCALDSCWANSPTGDLSLQNPSSASEPRPELAPEPIPEWGLTESTAVEQLGDTWNARPQHERLESPMSSSPAGIIAPLHVGRVGRGRA